MILGHLVDLIVSITIHSIVVDNKVLDRAVRIDQTLVPHINMSHSPVIPLIRILKLTSQISLDIPPITQATQTDSYRNSNQAQISLEDYKLPTIQTGQICQCRIPRIDLLLGRHSTMPTGSRSHIRTVLLMAKQIPVIRTILVTVTIRTAFNSLLNHHLPRKLTILLKTKAKVRILTTSITNPEVPTSTMRQKISPDMITCLSKRVFMSMKALMKIALTMKVYIMYNLLAKKSNTHVASANLPSRPETSYSSTCEKITVKPNLPGVPNLPIIPSKSTFTILIILLLPGQLFALPQSLIVRPNQDSISGLRSILLSKFGTYQILIPQKASYRQTLVVESHWEIVHI